MSSGTKPSNRFYVETWGCQMNELDSQRMTGQLMVQGLLPTHDPEEADIILLNSCSVREKAEHKVYSRLGEYRLYKNARPEVMIGLCGCVAQQEGEKALKRVPDLDFVLGPARVGELTDVILERQSGKRVVATGFPEDRPYDMDAISRDGTHKGMVTIIEGCDKKCTFCIVPATRGPERCRPIAEILSEVQHLLEYGFVEIELLGQTVNHWREPGGDLDFADLLDAVHLPVQSGSNRVLQVMGRGYTVEEYDRLIGDLRIARPDLALSTDIIVGFPGETEEEFQQTLDLIERTRYSSIFAFNYSPRPHTAAPRLGNEVPKEIADARLQRLFALQQEIQHQLNEDLVGDVFEVLITGPGREPESCVGRTPCHRVVHFPLPESQPSMGSLTPVRIERALPHSLLGAPTSP
jgi:tRNA-2-methylthio-N6-dimethylallyladenosine synthase